MSLIGKDAFQEIEVIHISNKIPCHEIRFFLKRKEGREEGRRGERKEGGKERRRRKEGRKGHREGGRKEEN